MSPRTGWAPVIDLGEVVPVGAVVPTTPDPVHAPRGVLLALLALLAAVALVADAPHPQLRPVMSTDYAPSNFLSVGDMLYVFQGPYFVPNHVVAYRLSDGRRAWQVDSPATATFERAARVGAASLLIPNPCVGAGPITTVAVDTATGHEMWRRPGVPEQLVTGGKLVVMSRPGPSNSCGGIFNQAAAPPAWDAVDVATGAVAWSVQLPRSVRLVPDLDDESRQSVAVAPDGTVVSRDLRTGTVTGYLRLPELALPVLPPVATDEPVEALPDLTVAGDLALVVDRRSGSARGPGVVVDITAYDRTVLRERWSVQTDGGQGDDRFRGEYYGVGGCGPVLCMYGPAWVVFLDPRDGRELWRTRLSVVAAEGANVLLADQEATHGQDPLGGLSVRDLRTGAVRADLSGWRALSGSWGRAGPVLGFTHANRTWLARVDLVRATVTSIGAAPGWYGSCDSQREYVVCRRLDGSLRAWRVTG